MSDRAYSAILLSRDEHVLSITLNNPARRNAIGPRMVNELLYAVSDGFDEPDVKCLLLTGAGKAFCAGGDFSQMTGGGDEAELPPKGDYADLLRLMIHAPKPIVARVNGHAMGGGLGLVAASHIAIGAHGAKLGTPEINVGLFPMMIMALLVRIMPRRPLVEMMLYGERVEAARAAELGILSRAVAPEALDEAVKEACAKLCSKSAITMKLGLQAFAKQDDMDLERALPFLREQIGACLATDDAREGLTAFLEKRQPEWRDK
jgi:enoyl-CoA hydratase/carnithine racemase